jgi:hypothetical protein
MAKKKSGKSDGAVKDLKAKVAKLRRRLDTAEVAIDRWRSKARKHKANAASAQAETERLRKRLDRETAPSAPATSAPRKTATKTAPRKATTKTTPKKPATKTAPRKAAKRPSTSPAARPAAGPSAADGAPDATWTLSALRAEAKRRQLTGYSRATKAQLLTRLR